MINNAIPLWMPSVTKNCDGEICSQDCHVACRQETYCVYDNGYSINEDMMLKFCVANFYIEHSWRELYSARIVSVNPLAP